MSGAHADRGTGSAGGTADDAGRLVRLLDEARAEALAVEAGRRAADARGQHGPLPGSMLAPATKRLDAEALETAAFGRWVLDALAPRVSLFGSDRSRISEAKEAMAGLLAGLAADDELEESQVPDDYEDGELLGDLFGDVEDEADCQHELGPAPIDIGESLRD